MKYVKSMNIGQKMFSKAQTMILTQPKDMQHETRIAYQRKSTQKWEYPPQPLVNLSLKNRKAHELRVLGFQ